MHPHALNRRAAVRVSFVAVAVVVYFGTLVAFAFVPSIDQAGAWSSLQWLIGVIGAAVVGDTVRPSGIATSAFTSAATTPTASSPTPAS